MIILLYSCKGTNKRAQYKTKKDFFVFIVEREYFRALLKGTNKRAKGVINDEDTSAFFGDLFGGLGNNAYLCRVIQRHKLNSGIMAVGKYPIGIQNFGEVRRDGYAYVDKTALMYKMVSEGKYYFLSRPRRFGKSLLLSTLEAYFEGQKELFEGLAIADKEKEWKKYPVLHVDLNAKQYDSREALQEMLNMHLERWEKQYGDNYKDRSPEERLTHVIEAAYEKTGMPVVILVDE